MKNERKKFNNCFMWLTIFLIILILLLIVFIAYGKNINNSKVSNNNSTTTTKKKDLIKKIDLSNEDKIKYNELIYSNYFYPISKLKDYYNKDLKYNVNYLESIESKIGFAWEIALEDNNIKKTYDKNYDGTDYTGAVSMKSQDFVKKYYEIFDESININEVLNYKNEDFHIVDDLVYGFYDTGRGLDEFALKIKDITYFEEQKIYVINMDYLTKFKTYDTGDEYNEEVNTDLILEYRDSKVLEYPSDMIYAQMEITFKKTNDGYAINSIVFDKI